EGHSIAASNGRENHARATPGERSSLNFGVGVLALTMLRARLASVSVFVALAGIAALVVPRLRVEADITHFLPAGEDRALAELSTAITSSELNRTITLTLAAPDASVAARSALALAEQ